MKNTLSPESYCCCSEGGMKLLPFLRIVFSLKFEEKPDYDKLKFMLIKTLLDSNETPDKKFDWMKSRPKQQLQPMLFEKDSKAQLSHQM